MSDATSTIIEQVLRSLGVDIVCAQVYMAMRETPQADAETVARRLNLQPTEVVDAVEALSALSLLRPGVDHSGGLRPVSYERAIQTLLRQHSEQLTLQRESLEILQSSMKELLASPLAHQESSRRLDIDVVTGSEELQSLLDSALLRATRTFCAISPTVPASKEVLEAARPIDEEMATRGVDIRVIYHPGVLSDSRNLQYAKWFASAGAQIRRAPMLPPRFILVDQISALVFTTRDRPARQALLVREPSLVAPLIDLFEATWATTEPLEGAEANSQEGAPSLQELALLRILAAGSTDEAAAKKLGISVRTVRRIMADLMERLGATSRFEAGHRATQRGWL